MQQNINTPFLDPFPNVNLIILRGWPGSGKSTLAKTEFPNRKHYEADMFFIQPNGKYKWDGRKIKNALEWCFNNVFEKLKNGEKVIVSNTFVKIPDLLHYTDKCLKENYSFKIIECSGEYENVHEVPEEKVLEMKNNFQKLPDFLEQYLFKFQVSFNEKLVKPKDHYTKEIPSYETQICVIVDMDGTLAIFDKKDRSPYEDWKLEKDKLNNNLKTILFALKYTHQDLKIIICSGRDEARSRIPTTNWLLSKNIPFDEIFMRKGGDARADDIVKDEIFRKNIEKKYHVIAVFDDRLSVCKLWWRLGLPLFRLGDPEANF